MAALLLMIVIIISHTSFTNRQAAVAVTHTYMVKRVSFSALHVAQLSVRKCEVVHIVPL